MAEKTYLQAISDGLRQEMRRDDRVFVFGEDVGVYGGAFKVTLGFQEEFGPWRVLDSPLAETAILGACTGAAIMGMRPVAEMQFADFISCGFDQLVNVAGKMYYRQGLSVNITVRLPSGGGFSGGPFHSQNPESSFAHIPGLKCVCPATPEDAKGLLVAAIEDPNPVLFFEHKHLYRRIKADVPDERYTTPFGEARIHREGEDVTLVTWGAMVFTAAEIESKLDAANNTAPSAASPASENGASPSSAFAETVSPLPAFPEIVSRAGACAGDARPRASMASASGDTDFGLRLMPSATVKGRISPCRAIRRRRSPSVKMPTGACLPSSTMAMPMPLADISTSASGMAVSACTMGRAAPLRMTSRTKVRRRRPSAPPGCERAKSSRLKPRASRQATAMASPRTKAAVVLAVGARFSGQASRATPASR